MRRLSLRLTIALLTFITGVTTASLWLMLPRSSPVEVRVEVSTPTPVPTQQGRSYGPAGGAGKCATKDGFPCSFSGFESSDGMSFSQMRVLYSSSKRANRELQRRLKGANEIIKREPFFDEQGKQTGEKVVATFPSSARYNGAAEILWTDGSRFAYISGTSLHNILEYEKDSMRQ